MSRLKRSILDLLGFKSASLTAKKYSNWPD